MDKEGTDVTCEGRECPFWGQQMHSVMRERGGFLPFTLSQSLDSLDRRLCIQGDHNKPFLGL